MLNFGVFYFMHIVGCFKVTAKFKIECYIYADLESKIFSEYILCKKIQVHYGYINFNYFVSF